MVSASPTVVHLNEVPAEEDRLALNEWLRQHGIDPNEVCVGPGFLEVDYKGWAGRWVVSYMAYDVNDNGARYVDPKSWQSRASRSIRHVRLVDRPSELPAGFVSELAPTCP